MASIKIIGSYERALVLSKKEAVAVISLLCGQLADSAVPGNAVNEAPHVRVDDLSSDLSGKLLFVTIKPEEWLK